MRLHRRWLALVLALCLLPGLASAQAYYHGDRDRMRVAVTVDDCYEADKVQAILELCQREEVHVTFFVLGDALREEDGELWRAVLDTGNEIGNHSYSHPNLTRESNWGIVDQLTRAQNKLDRVLGYAYPMKIMRPPYGSFDVEGDMGRVRRAIYAAGPEHIILWDVSQTDPEKAYRRVRNGSILLYHARAQDVRCLEELIPRLKADGYELCTVSELLGFDPVATDTDL